MATLTTGPVHLDLGSVALDGDLHLPQAADGLIVFAHGSGSSRFSSRNRLVARALQEAGFGTLLMDLLTSAEDAEDRQTAEYRFDIPMLGERVIRVLDWIELHEQLKTLPIALFGASTGAAAALIAAAARPDVVEAVVSRGGRPDLADDALPLVQAPTLLIVGGADNPVIAVNRDAMHRMRTKVELAIVPGATHLFEEEGALEQVASLARAWLTTHLSDQ
jgi:pimeloyl-ACP methyl ester carboxylesterase